MLGRKLGLKQIQNKLQGKRILFRGDFNVPIKNGQVADASRIQETLPSIKYILENRAKSLVLMSHLGRPDGHKVAQDSLKPLVPIFEDLLQRKVRFLEDCVGAEVENACQNAKEGEIILLENLRFHSEEEGKTTVNGESVKADPAKVEKFRKSLSSLGEIFVNDAFGTAHRAHSSMVGVNLPLRVAGLLMKKELDYFEHVLEKPKRPLIVVLGGAKIRDKIQLISNIVDLADEIIIGGGMSYTFRKVAFGMPIGDSLFDKEGAKIVPEILQKIKDQGKKIHFPVDYWVADKFDNEANKKVVDATTGIPDGWMGLDTGPESLKLFHDVLQNAKTVFWNGPIGAFEMPNFSNGSITIGKSIIDATQKGAITVAGGGDTLNLLKKVPNAKEKLSHVSTGGGATLELVEGKKLPGVEALSNESELNKA